MPSKKLLQTVMLLFLLGLLTGCGTKENVYLRNDSKPYFITAGGDVITAQDGTVIQDGDVCMSPGAYYEIMLCASQGCGDIK